MVDDFKIFAISETDLCGFDENKPFSSPQYKTLWHKKKAGAKFCRLLLFIDLNIKFKRREDLEISLLPSIWIEVHNKAQKKILLGFVYREFQTPSTTLDPSIYGRNENAQLHRLKTFGNEVSMACTECERVILMGDFNINLLKRDDKEFYLPKILQEYEGIVGENGLTHKRMGVTFERVLKDGTLIQSELDHLITSCPDEIKEFGAFPFDNSDHKGIMAEILFEKPKPEKSLLQQEI